MAFKVETVKFEGPLDLMLHLIREQKLDIFDLDMTVLADQYIAYLKEMENRQLEVESEYLVELSTLIEYKSKKLLPKREDATEEDIEDPRAKLVQRLLEYQKYKDVSSLLYEAYLERQQQQSKALSYETNSDESEDDNLKLNLDPSLLYRAMQKVIKRALLNKPLETRVTAKELSTQDRILAIEAKLDSLPVFFTFEELCADCQSINELIVTFLAVLELIKDHLLYFDLQDDDHLLLGKEMANA